MKRGLLGHIKKQILEGSWRAFLMKGRHDIALGGQEAAVQRERGGGMKGVHSIVLKKRKKNYESLFIRGVEAMWIRSTMGKRSRVQWGGKAVWVS